MYIISNLRKPKIFTVTESYFLHRYKSKQMNLEKMKKYVIFLYGNNGL